MNDRRARDVARRPTSPRSRSHPKNPDIVYHRQHRRRGSRPTAARRSPRSAARPAATTITASGSIPNNPDIIAHRVRPGRDHHGERRRDVELLVQPADRAVLPRQHRQRVPVPRLRRPAGERLGVRRRAAATTAQITFRDWHPVGVEEYGYVAPDPLDPDIVYGGKVTRYDRRTGQVQNVAPEAAARRRTTASCARSRCCSRRSIRTTLYFASNIAVEDDERRRRLDADQPRPDAQDVGRCRRASASTRDTPAAQPTQRGVIYTIAPSPLDVNRIWAGTDDGLIHVTRDGGKTWNDVTPPAARRRGQGLDHRRVALRREHGVRRGQHASASTICGRTSTARATAARPGRRSRSGIPDGAIVNVVREDPKRRGLLFAGTEHAGLRLVRRRRPLAVAAAEHAGDVDPRSRRSTTTTSSSARTAAASGSSTTSRRCGRSTRARSRPTRILFKPQHGDCGCAGT